MFETLRASQLMTREVVTVTATASLRSAARTMTERHIHCLIVPPPAPGRCVGVVTLKDIVQVLCEADVAVLDQLTVRDVMTTPAFALQQDYTVLDCIQLMRMSGVRNAPVLDGTKVVGLLSFTDVVKAAAGA